MGGVRLCIVFDFVWSSAVGGVRLCWWCWVVCGVCCMWCSTTAYRFSDRC